VWAYAGFSADKLDLYVTTTPASPAWSFIATLTPTASGSQVLSTTFALPTGTLQAIRGRFRYLGSASPCSAGSYNDQDDLVYATQ